MVKTVKLNVPARNKTEALRLAKTQAKNNDWLLKDLKLTKLPAITGFKIYNATFKSKPKK